MQPYWTDGEREVRQGDAWALAGQLAPASVDCLVTSPPYWGLRDYGVEGQCGLEAHPQEWLEKMVDLFVRLRPALKPTATLWVNLGDTYGGDSFRARKSAEAFVSDNADHNTGNRRSAAAQGWYRRKQLLLLPSRFAIAMMDAGFLLRNKVIWAKPNAMPSSARDRLTTKHETVFFFTLGPKYYFDLEAVRVPHTQQSIERASYGYRPAKGDDANNYGDGFMRNDGEPVVFNPSGANPGDVWSICPAPFPQAHFATFPPQLVERPLKAGCPREVCVECGKPKVRGTRTTRRPRGDCFGRRDVGAHDHGQAGRPAEVAYTETLGWRPTCDCGAAFVPGLVLDPFLGSGTTLCVAKELGLRGIGFELNPTYCAMAARRIANWQRPKAMVTAEANGQATLFDATAAGKGAGAPGGGGLSARCSVLTPEVEEVAAG
jgi:DNA modification methylase